MIRYTVVWHDEAQNLLAEVWLKSPDRIAVTAATHALDIQLASDPELKGIPVEGDLRELIFAPLRIWFSVGEADRLVKVVHVEKL
jgi:hypothetical protein